jgi:hypothetical protein
MIDWKNVELDPVKLAVFLLPKENFVVGLR